MARKSEQRSGKKKFIKGNTYVMVKRVIEHKTANYNMEVQCFVSGIVFVKWRSIEFALITSAPKLLCHKRRIFTSVCEVFG